MEYKQSSNHQITVVCRRIAVITPIEVVNQHRMDKRALSILLFAKRILKKYSALGMYGFDEAAMVFLEQAVEAEKQGKEFKKQIEFTVKLMLRHQTRNHLAQNIIHENTAFQKHITNHILVNLNRLLTVDKRVYSGLNQITRNNVQIKEAYDRIVKLENYEKKLVFQVQSQHMIKPKMFQSSVYQMFERMFQKNQVKLSNQIFQESIARKQFKQNLNKLLELQTFRKNMERHEFLHVMKHGTLEERREAMDILKGAVTQVNQTVLKSQVRNMVRKEITSPLIYQDVHIEHSLVQKKETTKLKELIVNQKREMETEHRLVKELQSKLTSQEQFIKNLAEEYAIEQKKDSPSRMTGMITRKLKSELHLDRMRYGME